MIFLSDFQPLSIAKINLFHQQPEFHRKIDVSVIVKKSSPKNLLADCRSTVGRQLTDRLPTAKQQVTDRLRKKKNCGKHEQLTWYNIP